MKKLLLALTLTTSFSAYSNNGYEITNSGIESGNVSNLEIDFANCTVYQATRDLGGETLHCDNNNELVKVFSDHRCVTVSHYRKLDDGKTSNTSFRFNCDSFINAGFNSSSMFVF